MVVNISFPSLSVWVLYHLNGQIKNFHTIFHTCPSYEHLLYLMVIGIKIEPIN